jgi:hypothetical protein
MRIRRRYIPGFWLSMLLVTPACTPASRPLSVSARGASQATRGPVTASPPGVTAFVNVDVIPMDTERVLPHQTVLVEGGWLTALGPASKVSVPKDAVRIDGRNHYLLPGLGDCHTHATMEGDSTESERKLFRWLADGVTTIRNADYGRDVNGLVEQFKARAAAGELWSPRIYVAGGWGPAHYYNYRSTSLNAKNSVPAVRLDSIAPYLAAYRAAGYDFLKVRNELRRDIVDSLLAAARRLKLPVVGHVPHHTITEALAPGAYTSIEHLDGYIAYLLRGDPSAPINRTNAGLASQGDPAALAYQRRQLDLSKIPGIAGATKRAGVWNCPTQSIHEAEESASSTDGIALTAQLEARRQLLRALQDSGAGLLLGTDASLFSSPATIHKELQALVRAGLTPYEALLTGTRNMARYFGTLDSTGTVAVGKRADLVLLRGNPLQDIRHTAAPAGVMLGGRWLSRAAIDQRLASSPSQRRNYYKEYAYQLRYDLQHPLLLLLQADTTGRLGLTDAQSAKLWQPRALQSYLDSLVRADSLGASPALPAVRQDLLGQVARDLGAIRALLRPVQQQVFDSLARIWTRQHATGRRVTIPGVRP